ncbi:hypothetical protein EPR50_G00113470 [Perca flavescens]|uniref:Uncharacterized protein n=1 Tax=Perca flavescens TaxID=8167 RepID=A0A484CRN1_PERFV|nr:hypothetical protein EPR50_G00113470 [Perca flavescens]
MRVLSEHQRTRSTPPPALQYGWKKATAGPPSRARRALRRPWSHTRTPSTSSSKPRVRARLRYTQGPEQPGDRGTQRGVIAGKHRTLPKHHIRN